MKEPAEERIFTVGEEGAGQRLDSFLAERCPDFSRSQIQQALAAGGVEVAGRSRPKSHRLSAGDRVRFRPPPVPELAAVPQDLPLSILHEDEDLLVVDKPAGLVVHPAPGHPDRTLVNALLHHCRRLASSGDDLRPGIVHRLDRDTTGLIAVALTGVAHRSLTEQLATRRLGRRYLALSWGRWSEAAGTVSGPIGRSPRHRQQMAVVSEGGRPAETRYQVEEDFDFVQLCRVSLATGRTHQIRVHFASSGHPIVGDALYGEDRRARNVRPIEKQQAARMVRLAGRQMLHAAGLTLVHPRGGESLTFSAPLPADMTEVVAGLRDRPGGPGSVGGFSDGA